MPRDADEFNDRVLWAKLSPAEARYVAEVLRTNDPQAAYLLAYPDTPSDALQSASTALQNRKHVRRILGAAYRKRAERMEIEPTAVILEVAKIAFSDIRAYLDDTGNLLPISEIGANAAAALGSIELSVEHDGDGEGYATTKKVKMWDKLGALKLLSQLLGMHVKRVEDVTRGGEFRIVRRLPEADNPLYQ